MYQFMPGQILASPAALDLLQDSPHSLHDLIGRHLAGDWGLVPAEDARANNQALADGSRLLSAYEVESGERVWIITEAEDDCGRRVATTILLPSEY